MASHPLNCNRCGNSVAVDSTFGQPTASYVVCPACQADMLLGEGGRMLELKSPIVGSAFSISRATITSGASVAMVESKETSVEFLARHASGDWGEQGMSVGDGEDDDGWDVEDDDEDDEDIETDIQMYERFVKEGKGQVHSVFRTSGGVKLWVMTYLGSGSPTAILLPDEY